MNEFFIDQNAANKENDNKTNSEVINGINILYCKANKHRGK